MRSVLDYDFASSASGEGDAAQESLQPHRSSWNSLLSPPQRELLQLQQPSRNSLPSRPPELRPQLRLLPRELLRSQQLRPWRQPLQCRPRKTDSRPDKSCPPSFPRCPEFPSTVPVSFQRASRRN